MDTKGIRRAVLDPIAKQGEPIGFDASIDTDRALIADEHINVRLALKGLSYGAQVTGITPEIVIVTKGDDFTGC